MPRRKNGPITLALPESLKPKTLTFFCELNGKELEALFSDPSIITDLQDLSASISMGILDLSQERAQVVKLLNASGIPVIAWQLLQEEQGYWYHMYNAPQAANSYARFTSWTAQNGLEWAAIGVDIEPDIGEFQQLMTHKMGLVRTLLHRGINRDDMFVARSAYIALVTQMESDGYQVESYEFPFILDELKAGSTLVRRIMGITDVPANKRVLMLYTSFFRPYGTAFLWSYSQDADAVAVGITGGGIELKGAMLKPPLDWDEFSKDLSIASHWSQNIHIFSLEGCIQQGFLSRLKEFDWDQPVKPLQPWTSLVAALRTFFQIALWLSAHPILSIAILVGALSLFIL